MAASGSAAERPLPAGVHYVFDTAVAADFSVLEGQKEFVRRFHRHSEEEPTLPMLTSACPGECQGQLPGPSRPRRLSQGSVRSGQTRAVGTSWTGREEFGPEAQFYARQQVRSFWGARRGGDLTAEC